MIVYFPSLHLIIADSYPFYINFKLTHLYSFRSLRNLTSWVENRELWCEQATKIRSRFNENKNVDAALARRLIREGSEELSSQTHPDNYIAAFMPGGSLFMRNPAIPLEVMYPNGIPEGKSHRRLNIDMSNVPDEDEYGAQVLVDSASKQYWINK